MSTRVRSFSGHWQTEKYFDLELVRQYIVPKLIPTYPIADNSAFLHIRRTDYVGANESYHGMPSREYYNDAVEHIRSRYENVKFYVFSDDPKWCHENFPEFTIVEGNNDYEDLYLMSLCRHAIIANSSFSWWGAWLNPRLDRIVIAPNRWFVVNLESKDIVPERWLKFEN